MRTCRSRNRGEGAADDYVGRSPVRRHRDRVRSPRPGGEEFGDPLEVYQEVEDGLDEGLHATFAEGDHQEFAPVTAPSRRSLLGARPRTGSGRVLPGSFPRSPAAGRFTSSRAATPAGQAGLGRKASRSPPVPPPRSDRPRAQRVARGWRYPVEGVAISAKRTLLPAGAKPDYVGDGVLRSSRARR